MAATVTAAGCGLLLWAAVAAACVPQGSIKLTPTGGSTGTTVTVAGSSFTFGNTAKVHWGGISGDVVATTPVGSNGTFSVTFAVPDSAANGQAIVAASQVDANGTAQGSPANALFNVITAGGTVTTVAPNVQEDATAAANGAAGLAPVDSPAPAAEPAAAPAPAPASPAAPVAASPRVRIAAPTTRTPAAAAPAPTAAPAPAPAPPAAAPAEPAAPAAPPAPAAEPARRSTMVSMAGSNSDDGLSTLSLGLIATGVALAAVASAIALAGRRSSDRPAMRRR